MSSKFSVFTTDYILAFLAIYLYNALKVLREPHTVYNFFVLGIVPGTNISISFVGWIQLVLLAVAAVALRRMYRTRKERIATFANVIGR